MIKSTGVKKLCHNLGAVAAPRERTRNGRIALTCALPTDVKSVQLKGTCIETAEPDATEMAAVEEHRDGFAAGNERIGVPRHMIETLWRRELETSPVLVKIRFVPEQDREVKLF